MNNCNLLHVLHVLRTKDLSGVSASGGGFFTPYNAVVVSRNDGVAVVVVVVCCGVDVAVVGNLRPTPNATGVNACEETMRRDAVVTTVETRIVSDV